MRNTLLLLCLGLTTSLFSQNVNVTHNATMTFTGQRLANVWGYASGGNEYALVGAYNGMAIVEVTDPNNPSLIVQIPGVGSNWREIKTYQHYAYVVSEGTGSKLQIVDLGNLPDPNPDYHTVDGPSGFSKSHALHVDEVKGYLYIYGSNLNSGKALVFNLNNDPYNPTYVGFVNHIGYVHDGFVENDMFYPAHIYAGQFAIINMANKSNPTLLATQTTPNAFPHNTWKSGNTLFTTDEVSNSYLTSYNISNPSNITELDRIQLTPGSGSIVHNTHVINDYAVTSWYKDGFAIVDVSRPANMVVTGSYDTYPVGSGGGFEGCWGVYPYFPSGTIVASNIRVNPTTNNGELWVMTPTYVRGCYLEGVVTDADTGFPLNGTSVQILSTSTSGVSNALGQYKIGQLDNGTFTARFSRLGYTTQDHSVALSNGVLTSLDVALQPDPPLPVEWTRFDAHLSGRDALLSWETASEFNNAGFEVQQSSNSGRDWQVLGFVPAQGSGATPAFYNYTAPALEPGVQFFRLRQIDQDGEFSFSPIRTLKVYGDRLQVELWPNPTIGESQLRVRTKQLGAVQIEVLDQLQRPTGVSLSLDVDAEALVPLDLAQLPAGSYYVRVRSAQEEQVLRVQKVE